MQKGPWNVLDPYKRVLGQRIGKQGKGNGRIPARGVGGGEEWVAREQEEIKAHLLVCKDGRGVAG